MRETGFAAVLRRELRRMVSRRLYFGVCVALPLFCILFMATIFGSGQMERIPVGVVDLDWTASSRSVTRTVEAVPTFRVSGHYADEQSARTATQRKEIYGYLVIPPRFETDLRGGRGATLRYYYHYALLSVGSEVRGAFETVLQPLAMTPVVTEAVALGVSERTAESFLVPVSSQSHPLYNPDLDYSVYLSQPFFFILFQVIVLLVTVYAVGSEIKKGNTVILTVSKGPEQKNVTVPSFLTMTEENAAQQANNLGLTVGQLKYVHNSAPAGQVIGQSIANGTTVASGTEITFTVSKGAEPTDTTVSKDVSFIVPNDLPSDTTIEVTFYQDGKAVGSKSISTDDDSVSFTFTGTSGTTAHVEAHFGDKTSSKEITF